MKSIIELIKGNDINGFLNDNWRKQPLYIPFDEKYEKEYVSVEEIDSYLNSGHLTFPFVSMIGKSGRTLGAEDLSYKEKGYPSTLVNRKVLMAEFLKGNSIIINYSHLVFEALGKLTKGLENDFESSVHGNIYITPSQSKGFLPHFDRHEVFVIQVHGTKKWYLYDKPYENPVAGQQLTDEEINRYEESGPSHEITLYPGDLLYVPKGVVHKAFTEEFDSIHITIGINHQREEYLISRLASNKVFFNDIIGIEKGDNSVEKVKKKLDGIIDSEYRKMMNVNQDEYVSIANIFKSIILVNLMDSEEELTEFLNSSEFHFEELLEGEFQGRKEAILKSLVSGRLKLKSLSNA